MEINHQSFLEIVFTFVSAIFTFVFGHNLWIVSRETKENTRIEVNTSDHFPMSDSAVKPERIADFRLISANESIKITDYKIEDNSVVATVKNDGAAKIAALELYPHPITLEAGKFAGYIASEEAESFAATETAEPQRESYAKYAKVLIENEAFGLIAGHQLEIVLLNNPSSLQTGEKLQVKVLFENRPIAGVRVSTGAENINDGKYLAHARTDENGLAAVEISGKGLWFLRTHFIRPHSDSDNFDWESLWASITFRV